MRHRARLLGLALVLLVPACSTRPKQFKVPGQLLYKDQSYIVKHNGSLSVKFLPIVEGGAAYDTYVANVNREDGSFIVDGRAGQGIPPGKYRIAIFQKVANALPEIGEMNDRFSDQKSKIIRDVADETPIVIDLAKPEG